MIILKNLLVIFGGASSEYGVSLISSSSVLRNIPRDKYNVYMLGITKDGGWYYYDGNIDDIEADKWYEKAHTKKALISPDRDDKALLIFDENGVEKLPIDVIFPVLHGKNGEDGTIQGLFELSGIPYVGCSHLSSAMCMDKAVTNTLCDAAAIAQARWAAFTKSEYESGSVDLQKIAEYLSYPIFVKPANAGSSVGISKAHNFGELQAALQVAFDNDYKAVLEESIVGREIECAVMGNENPVASPVGEILPAAEFYDYDAKYNDNSTGLKIPADLDKETADKIRETAIKAYKALGCTGLSRVDFFLGRDKTIYINELNTLPGFTKISMFPKLFTEAGFAYSEIIDNLIKLAESRQR